MSTTINSTPPISTKFFNAEYDRLGNLTDGTNQAKKITELVNECYTKQMNKKFGVAELVALFEAFSGALLGFCAPSPATWTNALTSFGEYGQVLIARTKLLGDTSPPSENTTKEELELAEKRIASAESRREGAMAWMQLGAGSLGAISNVLDLVKKGDDNDVKELSISKKVGLSIASFISAVCMFFGWGEKSLMSTISKDGPESDNIRMNAHSDLRCFIEWSSMTVYPWIRGFKSIRKGLDILIPYLAIREGLGHLVRNGISKLINNDTPLNFEKSIGKLASKVLKTIFLINSDKKENDESNGIPKLFYSDWFLGKNNKDGFRSKCLLKVLKLFGCNSPNAWLKDEKLVVEYPMEKELSKTTEKETQTQDNTYTQKSTETPSILHSPIVSIAPAH